MGTSQPLGSGRCLHLGTDVKDFEDTWVLSDLTARTNTCTQTVYLGDALPYGTGRCLRKLTLSTTTDTWVVLGKYLGVYQPYGSVKHSHPWDN